MHESFDLSDPELREAAAGEYALGTLTRDERAAFESLLAVSHDLQRDVERWREHLNVFNEQLPPVTPPAHVWQGIAEATGVYGRKIEDPAELAPAMKHALSLGKPAVLDVVIDGSL